ncbi:MAG: hypothetical protein ACI9CB_002153 [Rhodothermales bacterium]|jgi:hypothetical protein
MIRKMMFRTRLLLALGVSGLLLIMTGCDRTANEAGTFATPEEAIQAVADLIGSGDEGKTEKIFGPGSASLFQTGDENADRRNAGLAKEMILTKVNFEDFDDKTKVVYIGEEAWPLPIPLVKTADGLRWRFDTAAGQEELLNRRIGRNELFTLASLRELVSAQEEYRAEGRDGNPPAYAQKFLSTEGRQDGLFWLSAEGVALSPIGDLLADAEDYSQAFHGYYYRMLTAQSQNAPGGEKTYLDEQGQLTGGFAVVAWPNKYGNSGVMTFQINQLGIVFQKDLGADTETAAAAIQVFDPDKSWDPTSDSLGVEESTEAVD